MIEEPDEEVVTIDNNWKNITAGSAVNIWRTAILIILSVLWLQGEGNEGILLLLFLTVMTLIRWRFELSSWSILIEQTILLVSVLIFPSAAYGLALHVFESMQKKQPWLTLPAFLFAAVYHDTSFIMFGGFILAAMIGGTLSGWLQDTKLYQREADEQRRIRYELEHVREELLLANAQGSRIAELAERDRIARRLHDDVGHEITASVLALHAFEELWKENDPEAKEVFEQLQERVISSADYLRETVHNLKPAEEFGVDGMYNIINHFTLCPVYFHVFGDSSRVPAHLWTILYPVLKEALTNIVRHAKPSQVDIKLDISRYIARLSIYNDDEREAKGSGSAGIGLRNLRYRAKSVGGSIVTDNSEGFRLICVLPIENKEEGEHNENLDRG
ncbi:sensor histidine kinase [Alkalicoccus daliensis]|uniref:histidine kinase n=1 Tax=Alkalicoccus daliensis TaxID=745820 RepID=A0A1H0F788_9BACI|nr:histidine kinase [Alkalicoccus daliensis]SDN90493.1 Signal transduction histidine kinase [Alkalicoccus daliensis]